MNPKLLLSQAKDMLENDVLKNPDVNAGMMIHVIPDIARLSGTLRSFDESVLAYGASIYAYTAIQWLEKHFN